MSIISENASRQIGLRIQSERRARGWNLNDLAEKSGVSRAMINRIERGESSPTAILLGRLSGAFGLTMSTLVARAEKSTGFLVRREEQPIWTDPATGYTRRQVWPQSDLPVELVEITLPPGAEVPMPASAYAFIRQLVWVRLGILVLIEGENRNVVEAGDCLQLGAPSDCVFRNEETKPCEYVVVILRNA